MPALLTQGSRHYNKSRNIRPCDSPAQLGYYQDSTSGPDDTASKGKLGQQRPLKLSSSSSNFDHSTDSQLTVASQSAYGYSSQASTHTGRDSKHATSGGLQPPTAVAARLVGHLDPHAPSVEKLARGQLRQRLGSSTGGPSSLNSGRLFHPTHTVSTSGLSRLKRRNEGRANRRMVLSHSALANPYALSELFSQSEIPGFREIFASDSYLRKLCWVVAFVMLTMWSLNDMSALVSEYNEHPITVNVLLRDSARLTFPAVTVCNLNVVRFSALCSPGSKFDLANKIPAELRDKLCGIQVVKKTGSGNRTDISDINSVGPPPSTTTAAPVTSAAPLTTTSGGTSPSDLPGVFTNSDIPKLSDHDSNPGSSRVLQMINIHTGDMNNTNHNHKTSNSTNTTRPTEHRPARPASKRGPQVDSKGSGAVRRLAKPSSIPRNKLNKQPTASRSAGITLGPAGSLERASQFMKPQSPVNLQGPVRPGGSRSSTNQVAQNPTGGAQTPPSSGSADLALPGGDSEGGGLMAGAEQPAPAAPPPPEEFELTERQERELQETLSNWLAVMHQREPELTLSLGHQLDDMIMRCTMKSINCTNQRSFEWQFSPTEGNCFTYRSRVKRRSPRSQEAGQGVASGAGPNHHAGSSVALGTSQQANAANQGGPLSVWRAPQASLFEEANLAGTSHGLELVLNLEKHEYISGSSQVGALVMIHHPGDLGYAAPEAIFVAPEFTTYIGLKMVKIRRLPAPYLERCVDAWPAKFAESLIRNSTYSQQDCIRICLQQSIQQQCACQYAFLPTLELEGAPSQQRIIICDTRRAETRQCVRELMSRAVDRVNNCECPAKCAVIRYDKTVSMARWPTREDKVTFDRGRADVNFQNLAKVIVYFQTMTCEEVSQEAVYSMTKILSALGGIMGMYVGFSFLSVFEIFEVMSRKLWHHFSAKLAS